MTLHTLPEPREGFSIITEGTLRPGDLVWNPFEETWGGATKLDIEAIGRHIPHYYAVCRKAPESCHEVK